MKEIKRNIAFIVVTILIMQCFEIFSILSLGKYEHACMYMLVFLCVKSVLGDSQ